MKPNFLFVGPDKSGSTWLYEVLRHHPECYVPICKDIYFFDRYYHRGMDWYLAHFKYAPENARAVGELCHDYLYSRIAAHRIARELPNVKLITCLRNPCERTFSHYLYLIRSGKTRMSFENALEHFPELINNSLYYKHLSVYFQEFERQQIKVCMFEDIKSDAKTFAKDIFEFLNLSFVENLHYDKQVLPASRPRSFLLAKFAKMGANAARELSLTSAVGLVKRSALVKLLYEPYDQTNKPRMDSTTQAWLLQEFYSDIVQLEHLLRMDLSHWYDKESQLVPQET